MSRTRLVALSLLLATLALYLPCSHHPFTLYDDGVYIAENPDVQAGLSWGGVKWAFTTFCGDNWHPLTWLSLMTDCQVFGLDAPSSHLINALLHSLNTVLVFLLLVRLLRVYPDDPAAQPQLFWPCAFVAALFGWHPVHVESVAWIAERKDVLSTFFALLALLVYTRYAQSRVERRESRAAAIDARRSAFDYLFCLFLFACSLMSKSMYVTLPFVMLLLDWWPLDRFKVPGSRFKVVLEKIPFFVMVVVVSVLTFLAQRRGGAVVTLDNVPLWFRPENAVVAYARYLLKMIWPMDLAVFYPLRHIPIAALLASVVVLVSLSIIAWRTRRDRPWLLIGWLWFLGTLVPVIGLVQVGAAALADRYTYFPSIGIFLAIAVTASKMARPHLGKIAIAMLVACVFLTRRQLDCWRDDVTLFSHAVAVTKDNDTAHLDYGYALEKAGRKAEAIDEYRASLKINPENAPALNNLGLLLEDQGRNDDAVKTFHQAIDADAGYTAARNNLGVLLVKLGRFDEAMQQYAESARIDPTEWHAPFLMGKALLKQGRDVEAIPYLRQAIHLAPNNPVGLLYVAQVLASDEDPKARDGNAAFVLAQKANVVTRGVEPAMIDAMAMAYAELGRFEDARNAAEDALTLATRDQMTNDIPLIAQRVELYKKNQPFRQSFKEDGTPDKTR